MKKLFTLIAISLIVLTACGKSEQEQLNDFYNGSIPENKIETSVSVTNNNMFDQTAAPEKGENIVVMETTLGTMKIRLFPEEAPKTVENFVGLIQKEYYDGIIFHRVIPDFMIQGGDPTGTGTGGESLWGADFEDEFDGEGKNIRGALSMANRGPNTNSSQFFVVQAPSTPWLDGRHTVFGQVFEGVDIIDKIVSVDRDARDKPLEDVVMKKVTVEQF